MTTLQERHDAARNEYIERRMTHDEFYGWLADQIDVKTIIGMGRITIPMLLASTDYHLNDIPLALWDGLDQTIRPQAHRAGMKSWSMGDTVCVAKTVARKLIMQEKARILPKSLEAIEELLDLVTAENVFETGCKYCNGRPPMSSRGEPLGKVRHEPACELEKARQALEDAKHAIRPLTQPKNSQ